MHIINADDQSAKYFLEIPAKEKIIFGIKNVQAKIKAENIDTGNGLSFKVSGTNFNIPVKGNFNIYIHTCNYILFI